MMTDKQANEFIEAFIHNFNTYIIDNDIETKVEKIETIKTNNGHGIAFTLKDAPTGPILYAEELEPTLKEASFEELVHSINNFITQKFETFTKNNLSNGCVDPNDNVIITALPTKDIPENYCKDCEYDEIDMIGLTTFLKVPYCDIRDAYQHIRPLTDDDDVDEIYQKALENTMMKAEIHGEMAKADDPEVPVMITLADVRRFADYFYIINKGLLQHIMETEHFSRVYVTPITPYVGRILGIPEGISQEKEMENLTLVIKPMLELYYQYSEMKDTLPALAFDKDSDTFSIMINTSKGDN